MVHLPLATYGREVFKWELLILFYGFFKLRQVKLTHPLVSSLPYFLIIEVIHMIDLSPEKIQDLFYKQVKNLTLTKMQSFDLQFSDAWL